MIEIEIPVVSAPGRTPSLLTYTSITQGESTGRVTGGCGHVMLAIYNPQGVVAAFHVTARPCVTCELIRNEDCLIPPMSEYFIGRFEADVFGLGDSGSDIELVCDSAEGYVRAFRLSA